MASQSDWEPPAASGRHRWPWLLLLALLAFAGGIAATGYVAVRSPLARRWLGLQPQIVTVPVVRPAVRLVAPPPAPDPALAERVARLERRVGGIDARTTAASGDADRAEGLLLAFAARRALDRGVSLGFLEGLLRERFGGGQPQAVATVISAARQPVTLEQLQIEFEAVAPALAGGGPKASWWDAARRELAGLIVLRRASAPSTLPADRLARARRELAVGHADLALAEVARMPGRDQAEAWIARARRYAMSRSALDVLETAALLAPAHPEPAVAVPDSQPTALPPAE